jgi:hypothetical protein
MTTLKHTVELIYIKSVDNIIDILNSISNHKCTIESTSITSVTLSIEMDYTPSLEDVLSLGTLIGSIQASSLV